MGIFIVLICTIILIVCCVSSYEGKVKTVIDCFSGALEQFSQLQNLNFTVQTNGKKVSEWDRQHKIDFIINNNKDEIIKTLKLYNKYVVWWSDNSQNIQCKAIAKADIIAENMLVLGNVFRRRCKNEIDLLTKNFNPGNIKYNLRTFTNLSRTIHYNSRTNAYWNDKTNVKITSFNVLTPDDVLRRVEILKAYNFEITEYQYNCDNQRKLMTPQLREQVRTRDSDICQICGKKCSAAEIEIDHIKPVSKGGKTTISNLQVLCQTCNRRKSNKWLGDSNVFVKTNTVTHTDKPQYNSFLKNDFDTSKYNKIKYNNLNNQKECINIGDKVTVLDIDNNIEKVYVMLEQQENLEYTVITRESPIGKAIFGQSVGDEIDVFTPNGIKKIKVLELQKSFFNKNNGNVE